MCVVCVAVCVLYVCPGAHQGQGMASLPAGQDTAPSPKVLQVFWGKVKATVGERGGAGGRHSQREANISPVSFQMLPKSGESAMLSG